MDLHSIRLQLLEQLAQPIESDLMHLGADELVRTGGKTATASVTNTGLHTSIRGDGVSRTDPFTRPRAVGGTQIRIKDSLAEMNIGSITDTDHQPGIGAGALFGPVQTMTGRADHSRIGSDVNAVHSCRCKDSTQVGDRGQILIAGTTDQLDPAPQMERFIAGQTGIPWRRNGQAPRS